MSKALIEFSLRAFANCRGKCLTDIVQRRLNESLGRRVGNKSNSTNASNHRLSIITHHSHNHEGVSSEHKRTFSSSNSLHFDRFPDYANPRRNPASADLDWEKVEHRSEIGVEIPSEVSHDDAVRSLLSARNSSKEENLERSGDGFWKYGAPLRSETVSSRRNYVVCYSDNMKIPVWVAECLTYECFTGPANRRHSRYVPDLSVRVKARTRNDDYRNSGNLSRGHMAAAANNKHDQESMDETFLLTNVLPQDRTINSGPWNHLERLARRLTDHYEEVRVISGPLLLPSDVNNGRVFVSYELIGESQIVVPTHLFKIVLAEGIRGHPRSLESIKDHPELSTDQPSPLLLAFVVPNSSKDLETSSGSGLKGYLQLERFLTTLEFVEERSGFEFFPQMDRKEVRQTDDLGKILQRIFN